MKMLIAWCQENLSMIGKFTANKNKPPFHLPEDMQFAWLEELHRVTKNDGLLLLSIHNEHLLPDEFPELQQQLK